MPNKTKLAESIFTFAISECTPGSSWRTSLMSGFKKFRGTRRSKFLSEKMKGKKPPLNTKLSLSTEACVEANEGTSNAGMSDPQAQVPGWGQIPQSGWWGGPLGFRDAEISSSSDAWRGSPVGELRQGLSTGSSPDPFPLECPAFNALESHSMSVCTVRSA